MFFNVNDYSIHWQIIICVSFTIGYQVFTFVTSIFGQAGVEQYVDKKITGCDIITVLLLHLLLRNKLHVMLHAISIAYIISNRREIICVPFRHSSSVRAISLPATKWIPQKYNCYFDLLSRRFIMIHCFDIFLFKF